MAGRARIFAAVLELALRKRHSFISSRHNIPAIWDIDTRALVRHLRKVGALRGVLATDGTPAEKLIAEARESTQPWPVQELASRVSCAARVCLG